MWIITPLDFFSTVCKSGDETTGTLTVRARVRSDLEALHETALPTLAPITGVQGTDCAWPASAPRERVQAALAEPASDIDYATFKSEVADRQGHRRSSLYHDVRSMLNRLQEDPAYEAEESVKRHACLQPSRRPMPTEAWWSTARLSCCCPSLRATMAAASGRSPRGVPIQASRRSRQPCARCWRLAGTGCGHTFRVNDAADTASMARCASHKLAVLVKMQGQAHSGRVQCAMVDCGMASYPWCRIGSGMAIGRPGADVQAMARDAASDGSANGACNAAVRCAINQGCSCADEPSLEQGAYHVCDAALVAQRRHPASRESRALVVLPFRVSRASRVLHCEYIAMQGYSMSRKTETLNLRVSPELKELARQAAARERRTVANLIDVLVREHCARNSITVEVSDQPSEEAWNPDPEGRT